MKKEKMPSERGLERNTDLFRVIDSQTKNNDCPLALRMRPLALDEIMGQEHILGKGRLLRRAIEADRIYSLVLYGPPGTGKTSLAWCIARNTKAFFVSINAVASNTQELRRIISEARQRKSVTGKKTIVFVDEIHRFNKAQQDVIIPFIEEGNPVFIGATVYNPFFSIVASLLSRSMVFELKPLSEKDILSILFSALRNKERGLGNMRISIDTDALEYLAKACEGDARRALNALEVGVLTTPPAADEQVKFDLNVAAESIQKKCVLYDKNGDLHYDTASAFIKSMRGSDPDAALYWMAKMLYAGEDPCFIARRISICAAEDVGNADPLALVLANAALQIAQFVGMPEAKIPLAQAVVYVACAQKSNAVYTAIQKASEDVENNKCQQVPFHLRDASYSGAQKFRGAKGYKNAHDYDGHFVKQKYSQRKVRYYEPTNMGHEAKIKQRIDNLRGDV